MQVRDAPGSRRTPPTPSTPFTPQSSPGQAREGPLTLLALWCMLGGCAHSSTPQAPAGSQRPNLTTALSPLCSVLGLMFTLLSAVLCLLMHPIQVEPQLVPCCVCSPWARHTCAECLCRRHLQPHPGREWLTAEFAPAAKKRRRSYAATDTRLKGATSVCRTQHATGNRR